MIICTLNDGIYCGSLMIMSKEIDGREVVELVQMGMTLAKIDILLDEVKVAKTEVKDFQQMYQLLEDKNGNIMLNGGVWRGRAIETIKRTFHTILQAGSITETYDQHKKMLINFLEMNKWPEKLEFISVGWVENYDKGIKINVKLTKRNADFIEQRLEIFKTKARIIKECKENTKLGKTIICFI